MKSELKLIEIETHLGAVYRFPDVTGDVYVPVGAGIDKSQSFFTIANISGSGLTIPYRIIKTIKVDGELLWTGPTQHGA